jgi:tRNA(Ile)-lysidine synthase
MQVNLEQGKYVVAVSGGVDSVVLLNVLSKVSELELIVAHLDHGIRPDSAQDAVFVMELAEKYGLPFVGGSVRLGPDASEEEARKCRYDFLRSVVRDSKAQAIITAHHQDDVIETAIINTLRGTGRKGMTSLQSTKDLKRPMLHISKQEIIDYAQKNKLKWREDSTNQDTRYLRNKVRQKLAKNLDKKTRERILDSLQTMQMINMELDALHAELLDQNSDNNTLNRQWFTSLPHAASREVLAYWLRSHEHSFDTKTLERVVNKIKTGRSNSKADIGSGNYILIEKRQISLKSSQSV